MKKQSQLLPVGFYDLLFDEAEENYKNVNKSLDTFLKAGHRLIKTPLVEFENSFPKQESQNYFQTVDVLSGQNLVFRNDITPQISRLLNSRLQDEKLPLKLCYSGDVLCAKSEDLYKDRQQTQVGIETIGGGEESDFETVETLLKALKEIISKSQEKELLIEFSLPDFLEIFLEELNLQNKAGIRKAIAGKDVSEVKRLAGGNAEIISKIMLSNNDLESLVKDISSQIQSQKLADEVKKAQKISHFLTKSFPEVKTCFDLFGDNECSYHSGISFDVFCGDFSYPIAKGGRYKISGDRNIDAIGATIYLNRLRRIA